MDFRTRGLKEDDSAVIPRPETEACVDGERTVESVALLQTTISVCDRLRLPREFGPRMKLNTG